MPTLNKSTPDGVFKLSIEWDDDIEQFSEETLAYLVEDLMALAADLTATVETPAATKGN